ncbi:MAG: protoheme IX farnesyltransferase [Cytophagales bacterium]|nr:MAG: protoheme IX farnesyltransferase [Cytophagales bacterium]
MITTKVAENEEIYIPYKTKLYAYYELLKPRLSFLVAFSAAFGYLLVSQTIDWFGLLSVAFGGFLISGASITINQMIEKEIDKKMRRTQNRPLPLNKITVQEAGVYALGVAMIGLSLLLYTTNLLTTGLAFLSMLLYSFVYTPLKRVGPIAVFVGAIPGALPPLLGVTAVSGTLNREALIVFAIQFIWQFPHFWSIAWVLDEDYQKAGFKLLPSSKGKTTWSAMQICLYSLLLIPMSALPYWVGISGGVSFIIAMLAGIIFAFPSFQLWLGGTDDRKHALRIMFGSFLYLPIVQIAYLLDKI